MIKDTILISSKIQTAEKQRENFIHAMKGLICYDTQSFYVEPRKTLILDKIMELHDIHYTKIFDYATRLETVNSDTKIKFDDREFEFYDITFNWYVDVYFYD